MHQPHEKEWKEWTVMFYFASDNPLAPSIVSQLKAIKDAGYHPEANIIAHFDPHTPQTPTHVFDVNHIEKLKALGCSQVGHANDPSVRNLVLDKVWSSGEDDVSIRRKIGALVGESLKKTLTDKVNGNGAHGNGGGGDDAGTNDAARKVAATTAPVTAAAASVLKEVTESHERRDFGLPVLDKVDGLAGEADPAVSLKNFLIFCKDTYPARHYILFLLGHGLVVGNKMFMLDEHTAPRHPAAATPAGGKAARVETTPATADEEIDVSGSLTLKGLSAALVAFNSYVPGGGKSGAAGTAKSDPPDEVKSDAAQTDATQAGADKSEAKKPGASRLELIGFHSCSMSGLEVACELEGQANYMMASQGPAFVGSWPYRQILLQLFNSLNASLGVKDLKNAPALLSRLKGGADPLSKYIRGALPDAVKEQLALHDASREPDEKTLKALAQGLRRVMNDRGLCEAEGVGDIGKMSGLTRRLFARSHSLRGANRRRLNRLLLADAYDGAITPNPDTGGTYIKELFKKFFYSVLYNSADFQLAGYSFDLCLCDLNEVGGLKARVDELAGALKAGMDGGAGLAPGTVPLARELILLAHWDAQSFWQDSYTDLYDFCFRLKRRCEHVFSWVGKAKQRGKQVAVLRRIVAACEGVMEALERGSKKLDRASKGEDRRAIVRAEFAGAEYQYSHGLSIYFPWSEPADGFFNGTGGKPGKYREYRLSLDTAWDDFLDEYFKKTQRESFGQENPKARAQAEADSRQNKTEAAILESLLRDIGTRVFTDGQLAKGAGNDATGKGAGNDASGDCDCSSVKNYPPFTIDPAPDPAPTAGPAPGPEPPAAPRPKRGAHSPNFFEQAGVISSPKSSS